jgi:hypothetical protein
MGGFVRTVIRSELGQTGPGWSFFGGSSAVFSFGIHSKMLQVMEEYYNVT